MKLLLHFKNLRTFIVLFLLSYSQSVSAQRNTVEKYIEAHKERAIKMMEKHNIPASVILGVAIHESAYGNSKLAQYLNNHFGIKGKNNSTEIRSAYKGYNSVEESYRDFVEFLRKRKQFSHLFDKYERYDYRDWTLGIARGGYASSKTWSKQVMGIIKKYELDRFDQNRTAHIEVDESTSFYIVKPGDSLYKIALKYKTTVDEIRSLNGLTSTRLQIGQELSL